MARQGINTGSSPDAGDGDALLIGAIKINANFSEIYTAIGDGTNITNAIGYAVTAGIATYANSSRIVIKDSGSTVGTAGTIDFGANLSVSAISAGVVTVTASGGTSSQFVTTAAGIHTLSNVGIGTTNPTSKLTVTGDGTFTGIVTASSFSGSGIGLTGIPAGQLTGVLPALDGSALIGVVGSGSGIVVKDSGTTVGTAGTIDFGDNLTVSAISAGIVTVTASSGGGSSLTVKEVAGRFGATNLSVSNVTELRFNNAAGFNVEDETGGVAFIDLGSTFNPWYVYGQDTLKADGEEPIEFVAGPGIAITTKAVSSVGIGTTLSKAITIGISNNLNFSGVTTLGTLNVGTGGTVITTTSAGLVGIGTTNPISQLDVLGTVNFDCNDGNTFTSVGIGTSIVDISTPLLNVDAPNIAINTPGGFFQTDVGTFILNSDTILLNSPFPQTFTLPTISIASSAPGLSGPATFTLGQNIDGSGEDHLGFIYDNFGGTSGIGGIARIFTSNGDLKIVTDFNGTATGSNITIGSEDIIFTDKTETLEYARFNSSGNLGIGTTNPTSALTVIGNTSLETLDVIEHTELNNLNVTGVSTFAGITTVTGPTLFTNQLSVSGIVTATSFRSTTTTGDGSDVGFAIKYYITASGSSAYRLAGPGVLNSTDNPTLYLHRGFTYIFENSTGGSHPFAIRTSSGGSGYTTSFLSGSQTGTQIFTVPFDAPNTLVYQCTHHSGMVGTLNIVT